MAELAIGITGGGTGAITPAGARTNLGLGTGNKPVFSSAQGGNLELVGNTLQSTNTNGDITISPAGTGSVIVSGNLKIGSIQGTAIGGGSAAAIRAVSTGPAIEVRETDAGLNEKSWDILAGGGDLVFRAVNDANNAATTYLQVQRTGTTIDSVSVPNGSFGVGRVPTNFIDFAQSTRSGTHATGRGFYATMSSNSGDNGFEFRHTNGTQGIGFGFNTIYATGNTTNQNLGLLARGTGVISLLSPTSLNSNRLMSIADGIVNTDGVSRGQLATVFSFVDAGSADSWTNTTFANFPNNRVRIASLVVKKTSSIAVAGIINRIQHSSANSPTFARLKLERTGFTTQFSSVFSLGNTQAWAFKQLKLNHAFNSIPAGTYNLEVELRVNAGTCGVFNDNNGSGSRYLEAVVIPN